ncbi:MAG: Uma2 family endonuclease [Nautiliaceae bacterium]
MALAIVEEYYTVKDYEHWEGDWELIKGRPYAIAPAPFNKHQWIAGKLAFLLNLKFRKCNKCFVLVEAEYRISEDTILRPDVSVICGKLEKYITKAPLIIFEIIFPSTRLRDEITKKKIYKINKVPFYVLVYPDEKVVILDLKKEKELNEVTLNTPCGDIEITKEEILEEIM